jgi:hypothetical protein
VNISACKVQSVISQAVTRMVMVWRFEVMSKNKILWRIRAMEGTPSPASDDVADGRCCCCSGGLVGAPLLPSTTVTWQRFPLWHNTRHCCWLRQQATGNGIKSQWSSMWTSQWIVSLWLRMTQWGLNQSVISQLRDSMWSGATQCESRSSEYSCSEWIGNVRNTNCVISSGRVWIVKSPSPVKSSSYVLSCIEWMAVTTG